MSDPGSRGPDLAVIVSPNGLGHVRRTLGVLHRLLALAPDLEVVVLVDAAALRHLDGWPIARDVLDRVGVVDGVVAPGATWSSDPAVYDDGRLRAWEARVAAVPAVQEASLVVSDNLAGVLSVRADAVLMGSFLVSDVLDDAHRGHHEVDAFVEHERELLARCRPPMLCVGPIAMPGVLERTNAVRLPWMCDVVASETGGPGVRARRVAVLGGRTGSADALLEDVAAALLEDGVEVVTPAGEGDAGFDHSAESYARCAAVVARPGLGTVHDCIGAAVPMVLAYEPGNGEMAHNAARLEQLGFGWDAGADASPSRVAELVSAALVPARRAAAAAAMAAAPRDGLRAAAAWLHARLEGM